MSVTPVSDRELRAMVLEALLLVVEAAALSRAASQGAEEPHGGPGARDGPTMGAPYAPHPALTVAATIPATDPETTEETVIVPVWDLPTDQPTE